MTTVAVISVDDLRSIIREEVVAALAEQRTAQPELLDRSELAAALNVSESSIDRWRRTGKLRPTVTLGESPRWALSHALEQLRGAT